MTQRHGLREVVEPLYNAATGGYFPLSPTGRKARTKLRKQKRVARHAEIKEFIRIVNRTPYGRGVQKVDIIPTGIQSQPIVNVTVVAKAATPNQVRAAAKQMLQVLRKEARQRKPDAKAA